MSINVDPSTWTLQTAGGIHYLLLEGYPTGDIEDGVNVEEKIVIRASDFTDFMESFTTITTWPGGIYQILPGRSCPGFPGAMTKSIAFAPFEPSKPWSPTGDTGDSYGQFLELTVKYSPAQYDETGGGSSDPDSLETYLEVSADMGVEFLQMKATPGTKFQASEAHYKAGTKTVVAAGAWEDPTEPDLPAGKIQPTTEWTVKFPKFPWSSLSWVMERCRSAIGKVNSKSMNVFGGVPAGTVLFTGIGIRGQVQYNASGWKKLAQIELKFSEKVIYENGVYKGHNYFFRPDVGTYDLLHINGKPVYSSYDLNLIWG